MRALLFSSPARDSFPSLYVRPSRKLCDEPAGVSKGEGIGRGRGGGEGVISPSERSSSLSLSSSSFPGFSLFFIFC